MDKNQKKIMPGCEKLTRPEEISALKDYLKQGIQENENSLIIGESNPLMSTPGDPILGNIDLEHQKLVMIDGSSVEIERKSINLDVSGSGNKAIPGDYLDKIQRENDLGNLREKRVNLELGDQKSEIPDNLQKLKLENTEINIENKKINLDLGDNSNPEVESYRESLSALSDEELSLFSFLSDIPGEGVEVNLEEKRVSLENIDIPELNEKRISLEKNNDPELKSTLLEILKNEVDPEERITTLVDSNKAELSEKRLPLKKEKDPELKSTLLEILKNEVDPEEQLISLNNDTEAELNEKIISIKKEKEPSVNLLNSLELPKDPGTDNITSWNEDSKADRNFLGDNNSEIKVEEKKISIKGDKDPIVGENNAIKTPKDPGTDNITSWSEESKKIDRGSVGDNLLDSIEVPHFESYKKDIIENVTDLSSNNISTWGVNNTFDVEYEEVSDKNPYIRRDLGDNNLTDDSDGLDSENLPKKTILGKNKIPRKGVDEQKNLVTSEKATSWKQLSSKESKNFDYEHLDENGENSDYSRNWIGDNNLKEGIEVPQFESYKESIIENVTDLSSNNISTWGSNDSSFDVEHEDLPYSRKDLGDNNLVKDSDSLDLELSKKTLIDKNKIPKRTDKEQNEDILTTSWKQENSDYSRNWIGDNNLKEGIEIPRFEKYKKEVEDNSINSGYTTWGVNNTFDIEHKDLSYSRKDLGDNNLVKDSSNLSEVFNQIETKKPKKELDLSFENGGELYKLNNPHVSEIDRELWQGIYKILEDIESKYENTNLGDGWKEQLLNSLIDNSNSTKTKYNSAKSRPNNVTSGDFTTWGANDSSFDVEYEEVNDKNPYIRRDLGDNNVIKHGDDSIEYDKKTDGVFGMKTKIESNGSNKNRKKRPLHQNPYFTINQDERKVELGPALANPKSLFSGGVSGIVSGIGETLNTEISITPILRSLADSISLIPGIPADIKQDLMDSVLKYLVELRDTFQATQKIAPHRLPGTDTKWWQKMLGGGSLKDMAKGLLEDTSGKNAPVNRPTIDETTGRLNSTSWKYWKEDGSSGNLEFKRDYVNRASYSDILIDSDSKIKYKATIEEDMATGLRTTLEDLASNTKVSSLEDLKRLLSSSPYITTAENIRQRKMTLDSNHTWELRLFPFLGDINGNCSWLPSIAEINAYNWYDHGVKTRWGEWLPVTSFELQSKKMTQKTLGLYDGEISYPVSMEFSNEVRLTLIDDQYKSWKRYFELCAECSTYLTEMVNKKTTKQDDKVDVIGFGDAGNGTMYYTELNEDVILSLKNTTPIVKGVICPGMYKNLTFRCLIYVMTPQMSTIQKFDLLLVLKDYSIEYSGEVDSSSPDLNISFSIVGENPGESIPKRETELAILEKEYKQEGFWEKIGNDIKGLGDWRNSLGGVMDILS